MIRQLQAGSSASGGNKEVSIWAAFSAVTVGLLMFILMVVRPALMRILNCNKKALLLFLISTERTQQQGEYGEAFMTLYLLRQIRKWKSATFNNAGWV